MTSDRRPPLKPTKEFTRVATPDDSFEGHGKRPAVTIKGAAEDVLTTKDEIMEALYLSEDDRHEDGSYRYAKDTVTVSFVPEDEGAQWKLKIRTTRTPKPVSTTLIYATPAGEDGSFTLAKGFVNHSNNELDNQHINSVKMHDFTLYSAMKEIRREKEPEWWYEHLKAYDKEAGTDYARAFWESLGTGNASPGAPHA